MPKINYEFVPTGLGDLLSAIRTAEQATARMRTSASKPMPGAGGMPGGGAGKGGGGGYKADPEMERYWKAQVKAAEQGGKALQREHDRQYKEKERAAARDAALKAREVKGLERYHARVDQISERNFQRRVARQEKEAKAKERARAKAEAESKGGGGFGMMAGGMLAAGLAYKAVSMVAGVVVNATREAIALQESTNRLSINARQAGQDFVDPHELRRDFQAAALANPGQSAQAISDALQSFVSLTGDLKVGRESAGTFATVASATGAQVSDVAQAAASIFNQFGLKTKAEMQDVLASLTFQGKTGAFELRDAASQFQRLAAAGASFGLTGTKGVKTIGGLAQIARTGTGSAEQTTTAIENIFSNLVAKSALLKGEGVDVFDKSGKTRDVTDVLIDAIVKAGGSDFEKKGQTLQKVFGDQGIRGVRPLLAKYQAAFQGVRNEGGSEQAAAAAGLKKLREEIDKSVNAPGSWEEVMMDAARAQTDFSAQWALQGERINAVIGDKILPVFEKVAPKVLELFMGEGDQQGPLLIAIEQFATAVALAGTALGEFVDSLYEIGALKRKEKTPEEQAAAALEEKRKAEKKLARFDEETGGMYALDKDGKPIGSDQFGPLNEAKVRERAALVADIASKKGSADVLAKTAKEQAEKDAAKRAAAGESAPGTVGAVWGASMGPGAATKDMTVEEFAEEYVKAGLEGGDQARYFEGEEGYRERAKKIGVDLLTTGASPVNMDSDANAAQRALAQNFISQGILGRTAAENAVAGNATWGGRTADNADKSQSERVAMAAQDIAALAESARTAADMLSKIQAKGQPDILGGP